MPDSQERKVAREAVIAHSKGEISDALFQRLIHYAMAKEIRSSLAAKSASYLKKYGRKAK